MPDPWDLREPAFHTAPEYEDTFGPEVARLNEQIGFAPDPEQKLVLNDLFAITDEGMAAAFESAVIATRQQLKTGLMKQSVIGWLFVTQEELTVWSAHLFPTAQEAFRDISGLILNSPMLRKRLPLGPSRGIHGARGDEHIELRDGRRLLFRSRTKTGARGLTGDKIVLDEAFALLPEHLGSILPTLTAVPDPQILYGSSAGLAYSRILREIRDRGRKGSPGLAYSEWAARRKSCADPDCEHWKPSHPLHRPGCALDDEELWAEASPLLGRQRGNGTGLTLAKMRKFREAEPPEEWMRERLGWWEEGGADDLFGTGNWEGTLGRHPGPHVALGALAVATSYDLRWSAIGAAALAGNRVVVQPLHHGPGTDWVVEAAAALHREHGVPVVVDQRGPAAVLIDDLETAVGDDGLHKADTTDALDAFDTLRQLVTDGDLLRETYPELESAVEAATTRTVGDRTALGRRGSSSDISALEAIMFAAWKVRRPVQAAPPPPPMPTRAPRPYRRQPTADPSRMAF